MKTLIVPIFALGVLLAGCKSGATKDGGTTQAPVYAGEVSNLQCVAGIGTAFFTWQYDRPGEISSVVVESYLGGKTALLFMSSGYTNCATVRLTPLVPITLTVRLVTPSGQASEGRRIKVIVSDIRVRHDMVDKKEMFIYLPRDYDTSVRRYPVIYMQDGQNLFPGTVGSSVKWDAGNVMDRLVSNGLMEEAIIVGIFHAGSKRAEEYVPYKADGEIGDFKVDGKGAAYSRFLSEQIVGYIDKNYRTVPDRKHRAVMGSSFGGLISLWTIMNHSDVFSMAGAFSPAAPWIFGDLAAFKKKDVRLWLDCGTAENTGKYYDYPSSVRRMVAILLTNGFAYGRDFFYYEDHKAFHNEEAWNKRLENAFILFLGKSPEKMTDLSLVFEKYTPLTTNKPVYFLNPMGTFNNGMKYSLMTLAKYRLSGATNAAVGPTGEISWNGDTNAEATVECGGVLKKLPIKK